MGHIADARNPSAPQNGAPAPRGTAQLPGRKGGSPPVRSLARLAVALSRLAGLLDESRPVVAPTHIRIELPEPVLRRHRLRVQQDRSFQVADHSLAIAAGQQRARPAARGGGLAVQLDGFPEVSLRAREPCCHRLRHGTWPRESIDGADMEVVRKASRAGTGKLQRFRPVVL